MDPSTQRMLERARARRQKLDEQLKNAGQEVPKRTPLQENNVSQLVKVTTEVEVVLSSPDPVKKIHVSPTKVGVFGVNRKENDLPTYPKSDNSVGSIDNAESNRERNIRSQLKRLGALYSDSQISSPIHRTENNFAVESEVTKSGKSSVRVARFAALADNIKQWEDDLSHTNYGQSSRDDKSVDSSTYCASHVKHATYSDSKQEGVPRELEITQENDVKKIEINPEANPKKIIHKDKMNEVKTVHPMPSKIELRTGTKKIEWDEKVLQILEAQGFSRSVSNARLVYDYSNRSSQDSSKKTPFYKSEASLKPASNDILINKAEKLPGHPSNVFSSTGAKTPGSDNSRFSRSISPVKNNEVKLGSKAAINSTESEDSSVPGRSIGSPRKVPVGSPKAGSVLHKASLFESTSPNKKTKDPAELPVSERMALFERNKGQALIPKAAFSMPVPAKLLDNSDSKKNQGPSSPEKIRLPGKLIVNNKVQNAEIPAKIAQEKLDDNCDSVSKKVASCRNIFEQSTAEKVGNKILSEQVDRQKDLDMLRNRWNKNKNLTHETLDEEQSKNQVKAIPAPPPLPQENKNALVQNSFSALPQVTQMIPKLPPCEEVCHWKDTHSGREMKMPESPHKTKDFSDMCKVKKIRVSPPKPGHLYPCLSDIEVTTTETESEVPDETERDSVSESSIVSESDGNTSFGREILEAAGIHRMPEAQPQTSRMDSSDSDLSESAVLADIDGCIDEALQGYDSSSDSDQGGPTPPKRTRDYSRSPPKGKRNTRQSPNSKSSQSFKYTPGSSSQGNSPLKSPEKSTVPNIPLKVVDGDQEIPLMHSVSFYRRQQNMGVKNTPVRQIIRPPEIIKEMHSELSSNNEQEEVRKKIAELLDEVLKQQTVISQASQALNLCMSTVEFSGSAEQVEGERLLLLATHKRQATLHEIQRLEVEGSLKPVSEAGEASSFDKGSLVLSDIALTLKKDYVRKLPSEETCYNFVCLVRSQEQVLATKVLAATPQNLQENCNLVWNTQLRLVNLYSDFKVTLEVYSLQTRREMLPHNVKYHIGNKKETGKSWLTPKKQRQDSRLIMPSVHSPAGPSAVRSPEFRMAGYVVFSLREISRTHFTLNKVSYSSPLEGNILLKMKSELSVDVSERGFLTMFEDISGFGAWHRRWFVLNGSVLAFWKYPDDERKVPIGQIDLNMCTTERVGLVSRDICARPNTFLLETTRPAQQDDRESLVLVKYQDRTMIRNLLSADTKEERLVWCSQLNKALAMLRAWGRKQK